MAMDPGFVMAMLRRKRSGLYQNTRGGPIISARNFAGKSSRKTRINTRNWQNRSISEQILVAEDRAFMEKT